MEKKDRSAFELFSTGIGLLGFGFIFVLTEKFPAPFDRHVAAVRYLGHAINVLGAVLVVVAFYKWSKRSIFDLDIHIDLRLSERLYLESSYCLASDLKQICALGSDAIGESHASEDLLRNRMSKCAHIIKKLTYQESSDPTIHGYYIVYPLTASGVKKIDRKMITSGKRLLNEDIASNFRTAKAIYVSMVCGDNLLTRACALFHLRSDLKHLSDLGSSASKLYAKPSTKAGLRLLRKNKFRPVDDQAGIWVLDR